MAESIYDLRQGADPNGEGVVSVSILLTSGVHSQRQNLF